MRRRFRQVDVFGATPYRGNPVAVVLDGEGLDTEQMQRLANWTNLSETTFVLPPTTPTASYRVRIFTPTQELPFAGHPTLGTCHAWLEGTTNPPAQVVQECAAGLVEIRRTDEGLAFAAPPLVRYGPVDAALVAHLAQILGIAAEEIQDAHWVDNGPGWVALLLPTAEAVLALRPGRVDHFVGAVGAYQPADPVAFEVRAFVPAGATMFEDPVTGSLNASLAHWLLQTGRAQAPYVARQGTVLGRDGRIHVTRDPDGTIWVGGSTTTCVAGEVDLAQLTE